MIIMEEYNSLFMLYYVFLLVALNFIGVSFVDGCVFFLEFFKRFIASTGIRLNLIWGRYLFFNR